jgi:5-hydroxyisourate hydrolase-like protein (transthyretin family)
LQGQTNRYELRFGVGDDFTRSGLSPPEPPFLRIVPVRFSVTGPEGRYHIPLLATPWSYSTYRGSWFVPDFERSSTRLRKTTPAPGKVI